MPDRRHVDFAVVGGGCAGLSFATALADRLPDKNVIVLESRERYAQDRTWCDWSVEAHPFEGQIARSWSRWRVRHQGRDIECSSKRYAY